MLPSKCMCKHAEMQWQRDSNKRQETGAQGARGQDRETRESVRERGRGEAGRDTERGREPNRERARAGKRGKQREGSHGRMVELGK